MGYTTEFQGSIKITPELTASQIKFIEGMFGDMRVWNPEEAKHLDFTWFDYKLTPSLDGLMWDGAEKFYDATEKMQYIIDRVIEKWPVIKFEGILQAQGEEFDDRWQLVVKDNKATKVEVAITGKVMECPDCGHKWEL